MPDDTAGSAADAATETARLNGTVRATPAGAT
jgi:hypothetical protein